jgi:hypothetical protein
VFACATADDQKTGLNGLSTKHLLQRNHSSNEDVHDMLRKFMREVKQESNSNQISYLCSSITHIQDCFWFG